jgi:hypothetical protein
MLTKVERGREMSMSDAYERRSYPRMNLPCQVLVVDRTASWRGDIVNLSLGGVIIDARGQACPENTCRLAFLFVRAEPVVVPAKVVGLRSGVQGERHLALSFFGLNFQSKTVLQNALLLEAKHTLRAREMTALVVDRSRVRRRCLCAALGLAGVNSKGVATILDTIQHLDDIQGSVTVFVGAPVGSATGPELVRFLMAEFPNFRVVALADDVSVEQAGDAGVRQRERIELLRKPWSTSRLVTVMAEEWHARAISEAVAVPAIAMLRARPTNKQHVDQQTSMI